MARVLQIIPSLHTGGAEQACLDVAMHLTEVGSEAFVVSCGGPGVELLDEAGVRHICRPVNSKNPLLMVANALWLAHFARENRVNVIHARSRAPAWSAYLASLIAGCAFVTTFHAAYHFSSDNTAGRCKKLYNGVMARADRIIAISEFIASHIREHYSDLAGDRLRVVPRGVDFEALAPERVNEERLETLRLAWRVAPGETLILLPARLSRLKGHAVFIEAMRQLPERCGHAKAVLLGGDPGRSPYGRELMRMIEDFGLRDRVVLADACSDMAAAYRLASLVVAPSVAPEGFGRVPIEAMAMGVPVIASRLGGFAETIRDGETGWLVRPDDPQELAKSIAQVLEMLDSQRSAVVERAKNESRTHYDKRRMVADTLAVYDEAIRARRQETHDARAKRR
ncbi:MAG: glycosyltransferase family 4 protein [Bdellovibrionales bacterium]